MLPFKYNRKMSLYITIPGTTPKVTMSAKESKSFPIGELTPSKRAAKPSKKSSTAAIPTKATAHPKLPSNTCTMAKQPHNKLPQVIKLGMFCFSFNTQQI